MKNCYRSATATLLVSLAVVLLSVGPTAATDCGDIVSDDGINISDLVYLVSYMFQGGPAPAFICLADVNGSGGSGPDIADLVYLVSYMFQSGPPPVATCCNECTSGQTRPCYTGPSGSLGVGICHAGTQTCVDGYWGPCLGDQTPEAEDCDGQDNDCDGITDNNLLPFDCPLTHGVCAVATSQCLSGSWICDYGPEYEPMEASCDGLDNDCDAQTDEMCPGKPHVAAWGCQADTCAISACAGGWANCNGAYADGCEFNLAANAGCSAYSNIGSMCGDEPDNMNPSNHGEQTYRIYFQECHDDVWPATTDFNVQFQLTVPPGMDYDLYVYNDACGILGSSTNGAGQTETVYYTWDDNWTGDDGQYLRVEVRFYGGNLCSDWNLHVSAWGTKSEK
jgi:hypothetical protein